MRLRVTLRLKLALVTLLLFFIPIIGVQISEQIKRDLLRSQEETLLFSARAVATVLASQPKLFIRERFHPPEDSSEVLYLPPLTSPLRLNGQLDDWPDVNDEASPSMGKGQILFSSEAWDPKSFSLRHITGVRGDYIYAVFIVDDDKVVYRRDGDNQLDRSDHVELRIEDKKGRQRLYRISPRHPGWVNGYLIPRGRRRAIREPRLQAVWELCEGGYVVELRLPREMVGTRLAFAVGDVDDEKKRTVKYVLGTNRQRKSNKDKKSNTAKKIKRTDAEISWIISPSETIESILKTLDRPNSRVSIVDANQRVRATCGELVSTPPPEAPSLRRQLLAPIYKLFTTSFSNANPEGPAALSTLDLDGVRQALAGEPALTRYIPVGEGEKDKKRLEVMAAIVPLKNADTTVGAVVVEQTTNSILALQNKVIEESITLAVLLFGGAGLALIFFAFRLSSRIRRVGRDAAGALTSSGKIRSIVPLRSRDELGDLSRTLADMLEQLRSQSNFRERMADNLEHEMRTPLAGISASLQNLAEELRTLPETKSRYITMALTDIKRLEALLAQIRDATSLQEMLSLDQREFFELDTAIEMWLEHSWKPAFSGVDFIYYRPEGEVPFNGDPQRIHQVLDKLVENAVSFHRRGSSIELELQRGVSSVIIIISNQGPGILREMQGQIFNSMVSKRDSGSKKTGGAHLGLGLYIVRTIVEYYSGTITVDSSETSSHTRFRVELPLQEKKGELKNG
ncbi:GHKL domain-containing protein [Desulforhopalus vacuolatus]|uniref:ATP-binding protein n=1 Tax=Desulforhopalus vacuolatus TaxID=40414 RepID=UPI0019665EB1|nr:ATP-binding protein [Desulforhopalus vacuolatus]MBM9519400.1 GHKL domain-containing protein [Desulforhopalus vacuolatus]